MKRKFLFAAILWALLCPNNLLAEEGGRSNEDLLFFEQEAAQLSLATKHLQTIREAPAIVTVVTAEEIRNMGARDLLDILRRVPGFGAAAGYYGRYVFEVRGIKDDDTNGILFLIDGIPVNSLFDGGLSNPLFQMTVDNIKQVEIIRGPGSALYGSNAFSGVVNVITKQGKEIDGAIVSGGGGTFDTYKFNLQTGKKQGSLDAAFFLDYYRTDGPRLDVPIDIFGNSGVTDFSIDRLDTGLRLAVGSLSLNSRLIRIEQGPYIGFGLALTDETEVNQMLAISELAYQHHFNEKTSLTVKGYFKQEGFTYNLELFPEGTGPFTEGLIGRPSAKEQHRGAEIQFDSHWIDSHRSIIGAVVERKQLYDPRFTTNLDPLTGGPLGFLQDVSDSGNFVLGNTRDIWAVYLQDEWSITEQIDLVAGVRHDRYSDFGSTTNPRVAAVWQFAQAWDAKLMYGTAFQAASFSNLYLINNLAFLGNPNLDPERMRTYEASVGYTTPGTEARVSYFNNDFEDKIQPLLQPSGVVIYGNRGGAKVQGVEVEMKQRFSLRAEAYANYTYQKGEDTETQREIPEVAAHKGNIGVNLSPVKYLNVNANLFMVGKKPRAVGDPRNDSPGYALLDLTLIAQEFYKGLEIRGSVHNLLDKEYADPLPPVIPGDLPREGRSLMVEALYRF